MPTIGMEIQWLSASGDLYSSKIPYPVRTWVELIGLDATAELLIKLGGTKIKPGSIFSNNSFVSKIFGPENAVKLGQNLFGSHIRVPLSNRFLSRYLRSKSHSIASIARILRVSDHTVRKYLKPDARQKQYPGDILSVYPKSKPGDGVAKYPDDKNARGTKA